MEFAESPPKADSLVLKKKVARANSDIIEK